MIFSFLKAFSSGCSMSRRLQEILEPLPESFRSPPEIFEADIPLYAGSSQAMCRIFNAEPVFVHEFPIAARFLTG
jgi:hypothetical protein